MLLVGYKGGEEKEHIRLKFSKLFVSVMPFDGKKLRCKYCLTGEAVQGASYSYIYQQNVAEKPVLLLMICVLLFKKNYLFLIT